VAASGGEANRSRPPEAGRRVHGDVAAGDRAAEDRAERHERVADRARIEAVRTQLVGEVLQVDPEDLREAGAAEVRQDTRGQRGLVAADRRRLIAVAAAVTDRAAARAVEPRVGSVA